MREGGATTATERIPSETAISEPILVGPQADDAWNEVDAISDALAPPREGWWPSFLPVKHKPALAVSLCRGAAGTRLHWFVRRSGSGNPNTWRRGRTYLGEAPDAAPPLPHAVAGPLRGILERHRWPADFDLVRGFVGSSVSALEHEMNSGATQCSHSQ